MKRMLSAIRLILTLRCEQSTQIVSDSLDRDLSAVERWAVRLHYISCWSCRRFGRKLYQLRSTLHEHPSGTDTAELSTDAVRKIQDAIQQAK